MSRNTSIACYVCDVDGGCVCDELYAHDDEGSEPDPYAYIDEIADRAIDAARDEEVGL